MHWDVFAGRNPQTKDEHNEQRAESDLVQRDSAPQGPAPVCVSNYSSMLTFVADERLISLGGLGRHHGC